MDASDVDARRNGDAAQPDEIAAGAPAPEAAPETADVTATGGGLRSTEATPPDQAAPRPLDLVASAPPPVRRLAMVAAAVAAFLLVARWRRRR